MAPSEFRNYLVWKLKVNGKPIMAPVAGASADKKAAAPSLDADDLAVDGGAGVAIDRADNVIVVKASKGGLIGKRYLKYLTKRYIAFVNAREFLRVVATQKDTYTVKQVRTGAEDEDEDEDEDEAED